MKVAPYSDDQLRDINKQMLENGWTIAEAAEKNTVMKFGNKQNLYMAFYRKGLPTNAKKAAKKAAEAVTV